jgi:hypothetical protein
MSIFTLLERRFIDSLSNMRTRKAWSLYQRLARVGSKDEKTAKINQGGTRADVFISYSRGDQAFALQLVGALAQRGSTAWLDRNDVLPAGEFREDIQAGIEEAGAFLFLLSPDSVISEECKKELDYAVSCRKKLIPVVYRAVDPDLVPQDLPDLDRIEDASFDHLFEKVLDALLIDKDDWNRSGRWQRLSREWNKNHKQNASLLLHGKELKRAEGWLKRAERWRLGGATRSRSQTRSRSSSFVRVVVSRIAPFLLVCSCFSC